MRSSGGWGPGATSQDGEQLLRISGSGTLGVFIATQFMLSMVTRGWVQFQGVGKASGFQMTKNLLILGLSLKQLHVFTLQYGAMGLLSQRQLAAQKWAPQGLLSRGPLWLVFSLSVLFPSVTPPPFICVGRYTSMYISLKDILSHTHSRMIKIRKLALTLRF